MKKTLATLALCTLPLLASAASDNARADVKELMQVAKADAMIDSIYGQMEQMMVGMSQQLGVQADERDIFNHHYKKMTELMKAEMSWQKLEGPMTDLYLKHFSEKEIQDLLAFYKTESGQAVLAKMPQLMGESMQLGQQMAMALMPQLQQLSQELEQELQAHRQAKAEKAE
ncbi:DUF2059 domain-containing protein [Gallaecimonas sp. GXIMD4217]|uniref:DUF2059 domain-containing protein n=1 Tax=Gallaecimonas sp. GXIMD4217 TaxID=3131927 RepID=UPI00311AC750